MKEKVLRLLQSNNFNDILLAIQLAYRLDFDEFNTIFGRPSQLEILPKQPPYYVFVREDLTYFIGPHYMGRANSEFTLEEFKKDPRYSDYINLTP